MKKPHARFRKAAHTFASGFKSLKIILSHKILPHKPPAHISLRHRFLIHKSSAFLLLDAVMGIFVCACGFALAFSFLSAQNAPKPSVYGAYKQLLLHSSTSPATIRADSRTDSSPALVYEGVRHTITESNLNLFLPTHIR